jgi:AcrR family transcriptional regulator
MATTMRADAIRNRRLILDAAREAFTEYGQDAQMDDIARRAGVGVGTLYRHFTTKEMLVGELIFLKLSDFAMRVRRKAEEESDPWAVFEGALRDQTDVMAGDAAHQRMPFAATEEALQRAEPAVRELREAWGVVIGRAKEAGVLREDFEVDDVRTLMCGLGSMMAADACGPVPYDWQRQLGIFLDGARATRG